MREPCDCGAEDCPRCYPFGQQRAEKDCPDDDDLEYNPNDPANRWMDFISKGY